MVTQQNILPVSVVNSRNKLQAIEVSMNNYHIHRNNEVHMLMLAAISGEHCLFLGPPGSNKTNLVVDFNSYIDNSRYFYWLMGQFTSPDEIFGPVDIAGMKSGMYRRIVTNRLPDADIAVLDEPFKASTAILNSLLHIMQERKFENDGTVLDVPLQFIVGASNELPEDGENLSALYDRFTLRTFVKYIDDSDEFIKLLQLSNKPKHLVDNITLQDLKDCQAIAAGFDLTKEALDSLTMLWSACKENKIVISDRRWRKLVKVMKAEAFLSNKTEVTSDELSVAHMMLWDKPEQITTINKLVSGCINPDNATASAIGEIVQDFMEEFEHDKDVIKSGRLIQMLNELKDKKKQLVTLRKSAVVDRVGIKIDNAVSAVVKKLQE